MEGSSERVGGMNREEARRDREGHRKRDTHMYIYTIFLEQILNMYILHIFGKVFRESVSLEKVNKSTLPCYIHV